MPKPPPRTSATKATADSMIESAKQQKKGSKAGLKAHEVRVTVVMTDEQNALLHDWARTRGCQFKEIAEEMADLYIEKAIEPFVKDGHRLRRRAGVEPPAGYAEWYEDDGKVDFSKYSGR